MSHIDSATRDRIRELNDAFRKGDRPDLGRVVITPGVRELVAAWPLGELGVYEAVQRFDDFTKTTTPTASTTSAPSSTRASDSFGRSITTTSTWNTARKTRPIPPRQRAC